MTIRIIFIALVAGLAVGGYALYKANAPRPLPAYETPRANEPAKEVEVGQTITEPAPKNCFITIDGQTYDVQPLRGIHPGGDIYKCDTDMSDIFHGKHGESVKRIEPYLVK